MRTHIDEIVEEEFAGCTKKPCLHMEAARKAAERVFRHGVWRGIEATGLQICPDPAYVQPAPAGEKPQPRCIHGIVFTDWCYRCLDRRKGERRKGIEFAGEIGGHPIYRLPLSPRLWHWCNRKKDRRKK